MSNIVASGLILATVSGLNIPAELNKREALELARSLAGSDASAFASVSDTAARESFKADCWSLFLSGLTDNDSSRAKRLDQRARADSDNFAESKNGKPLSKLAKMNAAYQAASLSGKNLFKKGVTTFKLSELVGDTFLVLVADPAPKTITVTPTTDDVAPPTTDGVAPPTTDDVAPPTTDDVAPPTTDDVAPPPAETTSDKETPVFIESRTDALTEAFMALPDSEQVSFFKDLCAYFEIKLGPNQYIKLKEAA